MLCKKAKGNTHDKSVTHVMLLFGIISSKLHFYPKHWYSVVGRSFLKANNVLPFWSLGGKPYLACCD